MMPKLSRFIAIAMLSIALAPFAGAQDWPAKPIQLIVGFPPGGPNDLVARALAQRLSDQLKQNIVVDNRPGANGIIAAGLVARAAPDGYTFLYNSSALALSPALYKKLQVDPLRELVPVNGTATLPLVLIVDKAFPANNFREWVAYLKQNPGRFNYGSPGAGNLAHIGMVMILRANGLDAVHAPYKGSTLAFTGLLGGDTQFQLDSVNSPLALIRAGKLKALFVTSRERSPVLPDVATLIENGMRDVDITGWQGIMAPAKTPPAIVQRFAGEIAKAMNSQEMQATMAAQGAYSIASTAEGYATFFAQEMARFKKTVDDMGLTLD